jgi:hypothetical protein
MGNDLWDDKCVKNKNQYKCQEAESNGAASWLFSYSFFKLGEGPAEGDVLYLKSCYHPVCGILR